MIPKEETMSGSSEDTGVIVALMERFNEQRLPKALALKTRVEQGECLSEHDITFLDEVFRDANHAMPLVDKHPELQPLASRAISLYKEITDKALENEKQS
jgi:hypothetical protein